MKYNYREVDNLLKTVKLDSKNGEERAKAMKTDPYRYDPVKSITHIYR